MKNLLLLAVEAAVLAGREIMNYYKGEEVELELKSDNSPLTIADKKANEIINRLLRTTGIPIISEENDQVPFEVRKKWASCWIVDPLDGTKEFVNRNGEFTVNIAFVSNGKPLLGVIFAPALGLLYFGIVKEQKAFRKNVNLEEAAGAEELVSEAVEIFPSKEKDLFQVVGSRSHMNEETLSFVEELKKKISHVQLVSKGSSLKFCLVAEGSANIYPRFGPTMEWDTAAGQAICEAVGLSCRFESGGSVTYNREDLKNGNFCVSHEG